MEEKDLYEIVGTNKVAIERIKDEQEKDRFIREKSKGTIKRLTTHIEIAKQKLKTTQSFRERMTLSTKIRQLEREIKVVESSYKQISTKEDREIYEEELKKLQNTRQNTSYVKIQSKQPKKPTEKGEERE